MKPFKIPHDIQNNKDKFKGKYNTKCKRTRKKVKGAFGLSKNKPYEEKYKDFI